MKTITLIFIIILTSVTTSFNRVEKESSITNVSSVSLNLDKDGLEMKNDMKEAIMSFSDSIPVDSLYFPDFL
jgi:hypothetical protein